MCFLRGSQTAVLLSRQANCCVSWEASKAVTVKRKGKEENAAYNARWQGMLQGPDWGKGVREGVES